MPQMQKSAAQMRHFFDRINFKMTHCCAVLKRFFMYILLRAAPYSLSIRP